MGSINRFDLASLIREYDLTSFFETGTWRGDGLYYSSRFDFKDLFSCEIMEAIYLKASERFKGNPKIHLFNGSSEQALPALNNQISGNCLFWLDAHYPGAEEGINTYNENAQDENTRLPLHQEMQMIRNLRPDQEDVIIVDDLRIYEEGPFKGGNMPDNILPPSKRNVDFAYELFAETHDILKLYDDHGYLLLLPKNKGVKKTKGRLSGFIRRYIRRFIFP